ncbi:MAG TPA: molybdate ABC transporter substrate-binding protein [Longimicrobiaceae bacterium]|nr:molybdate ABC transporter substrate-binding protein [Longimicrobiaceae bacterium]
MTAPEGSRARRVLGLVAIAVVGLAVAEAVNWRDHTPPREVVTVSAASSLREAMADVTRIYAAEHPAVDVRVNLGGSGTLARQIEQGAEVDLFVSASATQMDALQAKGLVDPRTRRVAAGNELVLIAPAASTVPARFADLADARVRRVALGAVPSVPAGEYARQALAALGLAKAVAPKAVYAQDVRQVLAWVAAGEADAGIVYRTDAAAGGARVRIVATAPSTTHRPVTYPLAVVTASRHRGAAMAFAAFLLGPRGREVLARRGFGVAP